MLGPDEMIHDADFSLYSAMSALELMDTKMDKPPPVLEVRYLSCPRISSCYREEALALFHRAPNGFSLLPGPRVPAGEQGSLAQQEQAHPAHTKQYRQSTVPFMTAAANKPATTGVRCADLD